MPSKKKKYNARFPAGRIKKIMQTDEEVGKVAQAVPVIISKALEMFIESLLKKSMDITQSRNAKTLTPSHMKQCILSESRFDFLKDLVKSVPDASIQEDNENNALAESNINFGVIPEESRHLELQLVPDSVATTSAASYIEQSTSSTHNRPPVIAYGSNAKEDIVKYNFAVNSSISANVEQPQLHVNVASHSIEHNESSSLISSISQSLSSLNNTDDGLCIDEDYDNSDV